MRRAIRAAALLVALVGASPASAQTNVPPDPSTLAIPDMTPTRDPEVIRNGWRFFYFHKAGVSYEQAYADFADCYRFLPAGNVANALPMFRPWTTAADPGPVLRRESVFGLGSDLMIAMVSGPIERRRRQARMRLCLEPRGYVRYPVSEEVWRALIDNYSARSIAMQAKVASGPAPGLEAVTR